ncbi:extracellular solute-binding protein [Clavibacter michiganensis subsp. phaseoli]|uniref:Extracellular solute-binding protein n=1 Tax=Clavibacter phaseoli TaxID=1734031 RepID=A0A8I0SC37_9MICO|nr:extracellular solute-binding protein [Clavibacter phaseoli]MBF4632721.1 extracellular solute-binding protein [Clavibacter phaseoli]
MFTRSTTRRSRRLLAVGAATLSIPLALSACTGGSSDASGDIELWFPTPADAAQEEILRGIYVDAFEESHPGTNVDLVFSPADALGQKQQTALAAGQGPSLVLTSGPSRLASYAEAGYIGDITSIVNESGLDQKILPWALEAGTVDGKVVALPNSYETLVLFYNKTLFEENNWQPPTDRASLETLAEEMTNKGIVPFAGGNADYRPIIEVTLSALLNQVAGPGYIHDALLGDASWADAPCVDSAQTMVDWFDKGWIAGSSEEYFTKGFAATYADFASGAAGMYISASYDFTQLPTFFGANGNTSEFDWVPLPPLSDDVPANVYPLAVGGTMSVNAQGRDTETAETYMTSLFENVDATWAPVAAGVDGATPLPLQFDASAVPDSVDPRIVDHYSKVNDASNNDMVGYVSYTSFGGKTEAFVISNVEKLVTGDLTSADFCGQLESASQEDLADGNVPAVWETAAR